MKLIKQFNKFILERKLKQYGIYDYIINDDGIVDVDGAVNLSDRELESIPFQFGKVTGNFQVVNNKLISLKGSPYEVGGIFGCNENKLTSLEFSPTEVAGSFYCYRNKLTSLQFAPAEVGGLFNCSYNRLKNLDCATNIKNDLVCLGNMINRFDSGFYGHVGGKIRFI